MSCTTSGSDYDQSSQEACRERAETLEDFFNRKHMLRLLRDGKKWKLYVRQYTYTHSEVGESHVVRDDLSRTVIVSLPGISDEDYMCDIMKDLQRIVRQGEVGHWYYGARAYIKSY